MIAKGLDFPNVTLVGVILADVGFYLPDFRSSEKMFQLLPSLNIIREYLDRIRIVEEGLSQYIRGPIDVTLLQPIKTIDPIHIIQLNNHLLIDNGDAVHSSSRRVASTLSKTTSFSGVIMIGLAR